jgi:hypothetical protein
MQYLVAQFLTQGLLTESQSEALWARFMRLQESAMKAKAEFLK